MTNNLIFLTDADLDKSVYRVFSSFQRLEEIFKEKKLTLVKPKLWDDPFENFILNSTRFLQNGRESSTRFSDNFYGQCWSLTKESDAMWRIYSPDKKGVKVKTTIRKLFTPLYQADHVHYKMSDVVYNQSAFVGKVKYKGIDKLTTMVKDHKRINKMILDQTGRGQASTFFYKRVAFRHEKEVRLIYHSPNNNKLDTFKFNINPIDIFDEIVFDPRMKEDFYHKYKSRLKESGFDKKIIQSGLYKLKII